MQATHSSHHYQVVFSDFYHDPHGAHGAHSDIDLSNQDHQRIDQELNQLLSANDLSFQHSPDFSMSGGNNLGNVDGGIDPCQTGNSNDIAIISAVGLPQFGVANKSVKSLLNGIRMLQREELSELAEQKVIKNAEKLREEEFKMGEVTIKSDAPQESHLIGKLENKSFEEEGVSLAKRFSIKRGAELHIKGNAEIVHANEGVEIEAGHLNQEKISSSEAFEFKAERGFENFDEPNFEFRRESLVVFRNLGDKQDIQEDFDLPADYRYS